MVSSIRERRTTLLLVDVQQAFNHPTFWGASRSTERFENNVSTLLKGFREHDVAPIIHVCHHSLFDGSPLNPETANGNGTRFMEFAEPLKDETILSKQVNSSFIGTDLERILRDCGIQQLVICGLTTDHCVSTTARMAANLGWNNKSGAYGHVQGGHVVVVSDACATHNRDQFSAETMHEVALASLKGEFAEIMTTEEVLKGLFLQ